MRRLIWIGLIVALVVGGILVWRDWRAQQADESTANLQTAIVERGDVQVTVRATGQVAAEQQAGVSFATAGTVAEVLVEAGDDVGAGQVLARLDGEAQRIAVEQAELAVQIAELNLDGLQAPPTEAEVTAAQAAVNSAWAAYVQLRDESVDPESLRIAELRYEQAMAVKSDAEQAYRDALGAASADAQLGAASFTAEIARLQLEQLRAGPPQASLSAALAQVSQAQAQLDLLQAGPTQAQLDQAAVNVEQTRVRLERAQAAYEDTVLRAPFAGVVTRVNVLEGALAAPGSFAAVELADLSRLHVIVQADEIDIAQIAPGQPVEMTVDALPDVILAGSVSQIADVSSQASGVIVYDVRIDLDPTDAAVRAGMTAAATIIVQEVQAALVVPNLYIRLDRESGQAFVNVQLADGTIAEREITLGAQNDTVSEVLAGLEEGDVVAIDLDTGGFSFFEGNGN
jgi:HlyD family secretion protein